MHHSEIKPEVRKLIAEGTVIPAHPLALDANRALDIKHQRALSRYYIDAGAGGLAVGVHTTQFAIRDVGLYRPVLELAAETAASWIRRPVAMVAGLAGPTRQAIAEAETARGIGYHAGLLSLAAMKSASEDEIIAHCEAVAREIPLVGFYLQPAVGGVILAADLLALDARVTDCNSAFFDVANNFHGCIAGCHEVLRRQGLMQGLWCLDPNEGLSPGQKQEIDRVCREHADLSDDAFVKANLEKWLA